MNSVSLTADGQVIALACSTIALGDQRTVKPLSSREWHELSGVLVRSEWGRPGELLGRDAEEIVNVLGLSGQLAERLAALLARGGQLAFELERLASRGIWVLTRAEEAYPPRLKKMLQGQAPPVLYGSGSQDALQDTALAIVGSRDADPGALQFTRELARTCARQQVAVISGAARGVDLEAMGAAIEAGGRAVGVTVDPLERLVRRPQLRAALGEEVLTLVTPFHPAARWQAGNAMRRNRLVYVLSRAAVVAASAAGSGGTWAGAIENLKRGWVPEFVREDATAGSRELVGAGALPLSEEMVGDVDVRRLFEACPPTLLRPEAALDGLELAHGTKGDSESQPPADPEDVFWVVWPRIEAFLQAPHSERDVAEVLHLQLGQARTWLERAVQEGLASIKRRPRKLYVVRDDDPDQLSLD